MLIEIKNRWSNNVMYACEAPSIKHALIEAVIKGANLRGANLSSTNLRGANLRGADLSDVDLRGSNLSSANLSSTSLRSADLRDADLRDADLRGANLSGADLRDADLRGANLSSTNLLGANLTFFKTDFFDTLIRAPKEIDGLKQALIDGKVSGSQYEGECACLVGTIANIRHEKYTELGNGLVPNSSRPAEQWFMNINRGDTPENNQVSKITVEWINEFKQLLEAAR